jgi:uncharacterized repeat protein (TIGR02543 family)
MKRILSSRKHHYLKRIGIFLIAVALIVGIVGMVSCDGGFYNLTMAVNPVGGGTATDLTGASPYPANTVVDIKAVEAAGYQFVEWIAAAGTFANATAAETTFTMPAQNVTVTAHFVGPLDHFTCYWINPETSGPIGENVTLEDEFGAVNATVGYVGGFGNPAAKDLGLPMPTPIWNPDHHFTAYNITYEAEPKEWQVEVKNQFGTQNLTVFGPVALVVPTQKVAPGDHEPPVGLDHFLLYTVLGGSSVEEVVGLYDEFGQDDEVLVYEPIAFANPVRKTHGGNVTNIMNPQAHLVFYSITCEISPSTQVLVRNQFGPRIYYVSGPDFLAVPSEKLSYEPIIP